MNRAIILVTGSRSVNERGKIYRLLDKERETLRDVGVEVKFLYHGDAEGVDRICAEWAHSRGIQPVSYPVTPEDWEFNPANAGILRNIAMKDAAIEMARDKQFVLIPVAFWDGSSTGTKHMIDSLRKSGYSTVTHLLGKSKSKRLFGDI